MQTVENTMSDKKYSGLRLMWNHCINFDVEYYVYNRILY